MYMYPKGGQSTEERGRAPVMAHPQRAPVASRSRTLERQHASLSALRHRSSAQGRTSAERGSASARQVSSASGWTQRSSSRATAEEPQPSGVGACTTAATFWCIYIMYRSVTCFGTSADARDLRQECRSCLPRRKLHADRPRTAHAGQ